MSLPCPECGQRLKCIETRAHPPNECKRRYECTTCNCRYSSVEALTEIPKTPTSRPVLAINIETLEIRMFNSIVQAAKSIGVDREIVYRICHGLNKTHGGYAFRFAKLTEINAPVKKDRK